MNSFATIIIRNPYVKVLLSIFFAVDVQFLSYAFAQDSCIGALSDKTSVEIKLPKSCDHSNLLKNNFFRVSQGEFSQKIYELETDISVLEKSIGLVDGSVSRHSFLGQLIAGVKSVFKLNPKSDDIDDQSCLTKKIHELISRLRQAEKYWEDLPVTMRKLESFGQSVKEIKQKILWCHGIADIDERVFWGENFLLVRMHRLWANEIKFGYCDLERSKRFEIKIVDGQLIDADGRLFNTSSSSKGIFIMNDEGRIFSFTSHFYNHSCLLSGQAVAAAGSWIVKNGVILQINDQSGHYLPARANFEQFLKRIKNQGIEIGQESISFLSSPETGFSFGASD